jgi:hypothetical protein
MIFFLLQHKLFHQQFSVILLSFVLAFELFIFFPQSAIFVVDPLRDVGD